METYERAIQRVAKAGKVQLAEKVFKCVAATERPLCLEELREAIAVEPGQRSLTSDRLINDVFGLLPWCGNLIVVDEEDFAVHFAHFTIKQFFLSVSDSPSLPNFRFDPIQLDHYFGKICVTYLNFNNFKTQVGEYRRDPQRLKPSDIINASLSAGLSRRVAYSWSRTGRRNKVRNMGNFDVLRQLQNEAGFDDLVSSPNLQSSYPFLVYARDFWLSHTSNITKADTDIWSSWAHLVFGEDTPAQLPWTRAEWTSCTEPVYKWIVKHGHCALVRLMLDIHKNKLPPVSRKYLLISSAAKGLLPLFNLVIDAGNNSPMELVTALQEACRNGQAEVVENLLKNNIDINAAPANSYNTTALQAATEGGHIGIVKRLLSIGADADAMPGNGNGRTTVQAAAECGHLEILEILLSAKANANALPAEEGYTALQAAARNGHITIVETLLGTNANVNAAPAPLGGRTALQAAAEGGHVDVVKILLAQNADANAPPALKRGRTALSAATEIGHTEIAELLFKAGAEVNSAISAYAGRTEMQAAAAGGHLEMMKILLRAGARLDTPASSYGGRTTLQAAAENGHLKMVKSLLAACVDVNAPPAMTQGCTALQAAAGKGHLKIVLKLLALQADVNASTDPRDWDFSKVMNSNCSQKLCINPIWIFHVLIKMEANVILAAST